MAHRNQFLTPAALESNDTYVSDLFHGRSTITCLFSSSLEAGAVSIGFVLMGCWFETFLRENGFLLDAGLANENSETSIKELGGRSSNGVLSEPSMIQSHSYLMAEKGRGRKCVCQFGEEGVMIPNRKAPAAMSTLDVLRQIHTV